MKATTITATLVAAFLFSAGGASPGWSQDTGRNFVVKSVHTAADSSQAKRQAVAYYDGLGRPVQTILRAGSPDGNDLVDRIEYDSLGRELRL